MDSPTQSRQNNCLRTGTVIFLTVLFYPYMGHAATPLWSGIIDPSRAVDWSQAGVPGGIPNRTTICTTLGTAGQAPAFVQSVTGVQINSALKACPAGETAALLILQTGQQGMP